MEAVIERAIAFLALAGLTIPSDVQERSNYFFLNGHQLYALCQSRIGEAEAYVMGFNDASARRDRVDKAANICPPPDAKSGQFVNVVCEALERNPSYRDWAAAHIVQRALSETWPCK